MSTYKAFFSKGLYSSFSFISDTGFHNFGFQGFSVEIKNLHFVQGLRESKQSVLLHKDP